ncbi:MAG TPA: LysR substrate-binding domain-containing protein [Alphaproteobacteria bacterium]|nr:LysR substrate-binding domain-containing protein [Alphaproteobacteria bacterium]
MHRRLPPLNSLRAFEAAARTGSFRRAAAELAIDHSAISRHIRGLEARLGAALFTAGRSVRLTEAGRAYFERVMRAFDEIDAATRALEARERPALRLSCESCIAVRWLAPRLSDRLSRDAALRIELRPGAEEAGVESGAADLAIRYGRPAVADAGVELVDLGRPPTLPACSPRFLAERGPFGGLDSLLAMPLLHEDNNRLWRDYLAAFGRPADLRPQLVYGDNHPAIEAAIAGRGVVLVDIYQAFDDLAAGRLVPALAQPIELDAYCLVARRGLLGADPAAARLRDWLVAEFAAMRRSFAEFLETGLFREPAP